MRRAAIAAITLACATILTLVWPARDVFTGGTTLRFTVWGMPFEDRLFLDQYVRTWERLNPGITINYQRYGDDIVMKYNAWATRGRGPDVMRVRITDYHGMVARGMLLPLNQFINDPTDGLDPSRLAQIPPHLIDTLRIDGELFGLPEDNAQFGMFYNRAIFEEYNAAHPDAPIPMPDEQRWTWDDLRRAAKLLTTRDERGNITTQGFDMAVWSWPFMSFFAQAGGTLWSEDGRSCLIDSEAGVRALELLRAMQREDGSFRPTLGAYNAGAGPEARFAAGRTAIFLDGSWRVPNLELVNPELDFAVAPLPMGDVDAVVSGSVLWCISAYAEHPREAWRFMRYLLDEPQAAAYWDMLRVAPPAHLGVLRSSAMRSTRGVTDADGCVIVPAMPESRYTDRAAWLTHAVTPEPRTGRVPGFVPAHEFQTDLEREIDLMLAEYLNESSTVSAKEALRAVVSRMERIMARDGVKAEK